MGGSRAGRRLGGRWVSRAAVMAVFLLFSRGSCGNERRPEEVESGASQSEGSAGTCSDERCSSDVSKIEAFEKWIRSQKLAVNKLEVKSIPGFRMGTVATDDIAEGELYIAIPDHMLMGPERVGPGSRLDKKLMKITKNQGISIQDQRRLLSEKNRVLMYFLLQMYNPKTESFWKPYFDIMPANLSSPIFWNEDELQELVGSEVPRMARIEKRRLRAIYDELREKIFKHDRKTFAKHAFTLKNWLWANGLYDSRVIQLNRQTGHGNVPTFIPLIDMVNCIESQDKTFIQYDQKLRAAVMFADRAVSRGVQVFESYGNKSNYEYLLYNGFVMQDNPNDCVYMSFPYSNANDVRQFCIATGEIPYQVREWAKSRSKDGKSALIKHIQEKRRGYETTVEQDNELLSRYSEGCHDDQLIKFTDLSTRSKYIAFMIKLRMNWDAGTCSSLEAA
eukprot:199883-Hanusia_phi.AAC.1